MTTVPTLIERLRALARSGHDAYSIATEAADRIEILEAFLIGDCECPCCLATVRCEPGCTFSEDAPSDAERMEAFRSVLFPDRNTTPIKK